MSTYTQYEECCATAALYALGALPEAETRAVQERLSAGCPLCAEAVADCAEISELLLTSVPPVAPPASVRERILTRVGAMEPPPPEQPETMVVRGNDSEWMRSTVSGVEIRPLLGKQTMMVRLEPGAVYPAHEHERAEQCYVLEGSITDADGVTVKAGDFVRMPAGSKHAPIHTDDGCVFLITYC